MMMGRMTSPSIEPSIEPNTKDWTWVLDAPCPECGYVAAELDRAELGRLLRDDASGWAAVLRQPTRPSGPTSRPGRRWSTPATSATCTASSASGWR